MTPHVWNIIAKIPGYYSDFYKYHCKRCSSDVSAQNSHFIDDECQKIGIDENCDVEMVKNVLTD